MPILNASTDPTTNHELRGLVAKFVADKITPVAAELDAEHAFPRELYQELGSLGLFGVTVPQLQGGLGGTSLDYFHVMEELSYGYSAVADQCGLVELLAGLLSRFGTESQRETYMARLLRAEIFGAYCLTEAHAGSDLAAIKTRAVEQPDGTWRLSGEKIFINNAPIADFGTVLAVTDPSLGHKGLSIFLVDLASPGVTRAYHELKMGQRASQVGGLIFDNVPLAPTALLGPRGGGFPIMMQILAKGRLGIAGLSLGIARRAIDEATIQAMNRTSFGKPIGTNQAISFRLAECATAYRAAYLLSEDAARRLDAADDATVACSMAKLAASECALECADAAVQVFGGAGFIQGYTVERLYRDARITTIYEGTSEMQKLIISRSLLGKQ